MLKSLIVLLLFLGGFVVGQDGTTFEMSSANYGVRNSAMANAGGLSVSGSYELQQQFGALNIGRMESERFKAGTAVKQPSDAGDGVPQKFKLQQNYPNPFNENTIFRFSVPHTSVVKITILSILGRELTTIYNATKEPGQFELAYHGIDAIGMPLPSGVYFCRMTTKEFDKTIKFAILR